MKNCRRYHRSTPAYHKPQSYDERFLRYAVGQTEFFVILGYLLPFSPTNSLKNQNFEKVKKTPGDIPGETPFYSCVLQMTIM